MSILDKLIALLSYVSKKQKEWDLAAYKRMLAKNRKGKSFYHYGILDVFMAHIGYAFILVVILSLLFFVIFSWNGIWLENHVLQEFPFVEGFDPNIALDAPKQLPYYLLKFYVFCAELFGADVKNISAKGFGIVSPFFVILGTWPIVHWSFKKHLSRVKKEKYEAKKSNKEIKEWLDSDDENMKNLSEDEKENYLRNLFGLDEINK